MTEFARINRLPPYVFNVIGELKAAARKRSEDVIDFSMGNPDGSSWWKRRSDRAHSDIQFQKGFPDCGARSADGTAGGTR